MNSINGRKGLQRKTKKKEIELVIGESITGHPLPGGDEVSSNERIIEKGVQLTAIN
jgi:hypothetical protein